MRRAAWPGIGLGVSGSQGAIRHFEQEYGRPHADDADMPLEILVGAVPASFAPEAEWRGRRRTTTWRIALGSPYGEPLRAAIEVRGVFGLPLLQSLLVEPLLSVATARRGEVLLPAAGIQRDGGALILLGGPRAGKSSLAVRALGRGFRILGDDHVILEGTGRVRPFPRRLRVYPDLAQTAPDVHRRLAPAWRRQLRLREAGRRMTRGAIRLPILLPSHEVGPPNAADATDATPRSLATESVVLLQRAPEVDEPALLALEPDRLAAEATRLLDADRSPLRAAGAAWAEACSRTSTIELDLLMRAWAGTPGCAATVPAGWPALQAFEYLERALGLS